MRRSLLAVLLASVVGVATTTECDDRERVILMAHAFDVSSSHRNDMQAILPDIANLEAAMERIFFKRLSAAVSFSDKPVLPLGDPRGDYCYREDRPFDDASIVDVASGLAIRSGRDWKESQLDAVWFSLNTGTLGWSVSYEGKETIRVVVVTTDSLPHLPGDFSVCPDSDASGCAMPDSLDPCLTDDYPTLERINNAAEWRAEIIFVVTGDVLSSWEELLDQYEYLHVVERANMVDGIVDIVCNDG